MLVEGSITRLVQASMIIDLSKHIDGAAQAAE